MFSLIIRKLVVTTNPLSGTVFVFLQEFCIPGAVMSAVSSRIFPLSLNHWITREVPKGCL